MKIKISNMINIVFFSLLFCGVVLGVTRISDNYVSSGDTKLNDTGIYANDVKSFTRAYDVVVCRNTTAAEYDRLAVECDVVCGDGNCQDDIENAITNVNDTGGGIVYLTAGKYNMTSSVDISGISYVKIIGAGMNNTVLEYFGFVKNSNENTYKVEFSDFTIDGKNVSGMLMNLANNCNDFRIKNMELRNSNSDFLMYWSNVDNLIVEDSVFYDGGLGVAKDNCAGSQNYTSDGKSIFKNNYFVKKNSLGGGLLTTGGTGNLMIEGNTFMDLSGNSYAAISIETTFGLAKNIQVVDNYFYGDGIDVGDEKLPTESAIISSNVITGGDKSSNCIKVIGVNKSIVSNNICHNTTTGIICSGNTTTQNVNCNIENNIIFATNNQNSSTDFDKGAIYATNVSYINIIGNTIESPSYQPWTPYAIDISGLNTNSKAVVTDNTINGSFVDANIVLIKYFADAYVKNNHINAGTLSYTSVGEYYDDNFINGNIGMNILTNQGSDVSSPLFQITADNSAFDEEVFYIKNDGTGYGINLQSTGVHSAYSHGLFINDDGSGAAAAVGIDDENTNTNFATLYILSKRKGILTTIESGSLPGISVVMNTSTTGAGILIDSEGSGVPLFIHSNSTSIVCNVTNESGLYYNNITHMYYGCNSTDWNPLWEI
jgi:hypothetical protein